MSNMPAIQFGKELRHLVPFDFEVELRRTAILNREIGLWSDDSRSGGIFFNLSKVEWVDLGAVVQLVVLIESALRNGINVKLALPLPVPRQSEDEWMMTTSIRSAAERTRWRVERRSAAHNFLDYLQFKQILGAQHISELPGELEILPDYDSSKNDEKRDSDLLTDGLYVTESIKDAPQREHFYRYIFPLTWVSREQTEDLQALSKFLASVIGESERGLEGIDANTIANVILYELVDNVVVHAKTTSWALVAAWARPTTFQPRFEHFMKCERPYIDWVTQTQGTVVEIVVGDSGRGIPDALTGSFQRAKASGEKVPMEGHNEKANVMLWAFDRWSSSKERSALRGTRGIYRVDRVVKKYNGLITIRGEDQLVGLDHGGPSYDRSIFPDIREKLGWTPGTVLRLTIPAFHERLPSRVLEPASPRQIRFRIFRLEAINAGGMAREVKEELKALFTQSSVDLPLCVVAIAGNEVEQIEGVEATIRDALDVRHPGTLILCGLPGGWNLIESIVHSINSDHEHRRMDWEAENPELHLIWDPVLVLGAEGQFVWAGVSKAYRKVLDALWSNNGIISTKRLEELVPDDKERTDVWLRMRNDTDLIMIHEENLELRFTLSDIFRHTNALLHNHIDKAGRGVLRGEIFRTPALFPVNKWLDVRQIMDEICCAELIFLALSTRLRENDWWSAQGPSVIISDSAAHPEHLELLKQYIGVKKKEVIPSETGAALLQGIRLLDSGSRVIIYCDIILSAEAVLRCLRQVLRDEAIPLAVICIFDARLKPEEPIELWGVEIPVIAFTSIEVLAEEGAKITRNINPITKQIEIENPENEEDTPNYGVGTQLLSSLIQKHNALHLSHIGRPIGRHFTFYIDATKLVVEDSINKAFDDVISKWIGHEHSYIPTSPSERIELWHPEPEPKESAPARRFAEWIENHRKDTSTRTIRREPAYGHWMFNTSQENRVRYPNVAIIDWGALTGTTIMQMVRLATQAGAEQILVCIFLSQLPPEEEAFFRSIDRMCVPDYSEYFKPNIQATLPGFTGRRRPDDELTYTVKLAYPHVTIKFLSRFPISTYNQNECPVCQQRVRLTQDEYPTELLEEFAHHQMEDRLKPRTREQIISTKPKDFDNREIDNESIIWMANKRGELSQALYSTKKRQEVFDEIDILTKEVSTLLSFPLERLGQLPTKEDRDGEHTLPHRILWLLHFLSIETQWLRKPPLHFQPLRDKLANISLQVVLSNNIPEAGRLDAIIVLRTSSKFIFASNVTNIFMAVTNQPALVDQLLYAIFTYISRPYHQSLRVLEPLKSGLEAIQKSIDDHLLTVTDKVADTVYTLTSKVQSEYAKANVRPLSTSQAWAKLQGEFRREYNKQSRHNTVPDNMARMLPGIDAGNIEEAIAKIEKGVPANECLDPGILIWLSQLHEYWSPCRLFMDNSVLPLIKQVKNVVSSKDGRRTIGTDTVTKLIEMAESRSSLAESELTKIINQMAKNPAAVLTQRNWDRYKTEVEWFWEKVLRKGPKFAPSGFLEFLDSVPVSLEHTFNDVYEEVKRKITYLEVEEDGLRQLSHEKPLVFCTRVLLRDAIRQVLENVDQHRESHHAIPEVRLSIVSNSERVRFTLSNNLTSSESETHGDGITRLQKRLQPFNATLLPNPRPNDGWASFSVDLSFERGL